MGKIVDDILGWLANMVQAVLLLLPESPFVAFVPDMTPFYTIMGYVNYFVPVGTLITITSSYVSAVLIYYAVRWVLRLGRYID